MIEETAVATAIKHYEAKIERLNKVILAVWDALDISDLATLRSLRKELAALDNLHHAPMCPANHYHGMRKPTGPCSCGATEEMYAKR